MSLVSRPTMEGAFLPSDVFKTCAVRICFFRRTLPAVSSPECPRSVRQSHCGEYDPSRVVRGGNGTCKNDTEQMLLDYAYSDEFCYGGVLALMVRSMASVF